MNDFPTDHVLTASGGGFFALAGSWLFRFVRRAREEGKLEQRVTSLEREVQEFRQDVKTDLRELRDLIMKRG